MNQPFQNSKIRSEHINRTAYIYIRVSTPAQIKNSIGSIAQQYGLKNRAIELGWSEERIVVIDHDLGVTGKIANGRDGFTFLLSEIARGHCGAVFCSKVDRLSRSFFDPFLLYKFCYVSDTLVIDEDGIYDLRDYNDQLLLGFKSTMSFAEEHLIRTRTQACRLLLAEQGKLRICLPVGFLYDDTGQIILDPDEEVQGAIRLVFEEFDRTGIARRVVKYFSRG